MPAATDLHPSERMALVNTVAVVVPACPLDCVTDVAMMSYVRCWSIDRVVHSLCECTD